MFLDFSWVAEPTAWGGLGTFILLKVVLGIDNLVFYFHFILAVTGR